jgi:hypothetical protein
VSSTPVHQIECRWQMGKDLSPIAWSFAGRSTEAWQWFDALKDAIRPAKPDAAAGIPEASAAYFPFDDGMAAMVWRQWSMDAISLSDGGARRPLVARILIGPKESLGVEAALAFCWTGRFRRMTQRPGQVNPGDRLKPIEARALDHVMTSSADDLDQVAVSQPGLATLTAAYLRHSGGALSVELPAAALGDPSAGRQIPLLWGLRRITHSWLTEPASEWPDDAWSFSTFEPPHGHAQTSGLPDIVFRSEQRGHQPWVVRREMTVAMREDGSPDDPDRYDEIAGLLTDAYRTLGGTELVRQLDAVAGANPSLRDRLRVIRQMVAAASDPSLVREYSAPIPGHIVTDIQALQANLADAGPGPEAETIVMQTVPQHQMPKRRSANEEAELGDILHGILSGPRDPHFDIALRELDALALPLPAATRALVRHLLPQYNWLVSDWNRPGDMRADQILTAICEIAVMPDIRKAEVRREVSNWAYELAAPPHLIRALSRAARLSGLDSIVHLKTALEPALCRRWLTDHSLPWDLLTPGVTDPMSR